MKGLLVRVGADLTAGGGRWNGPVDTQSYRFAYVPIPERKPCLPGLETPYRGIRDSVAAFQVNLPPHLDGGLMHLDPDFEYLTYGDRGRKGQQLAATLSPDDLVVFYSGLRDIRTGSLVYAIIGLFIVNRIVPARSVAAAERFRNAHTRRILPPNADDVIVVATERGSGRLKHCIPIGEYRARAYRLTETLLVVWGALSVRDGYLQRSAVFPLLQDASMFWKWWKTQNVALVRANNLA
jgi:Nucleotide modification associated domain 3